MQAHERCLWRSDTGYDEGAGAAQQRDKERRGIFSAIWSGLGLIETGIACSVSIRCTGKVIACRVGRMGHATCHGDGFGHWVAGLCSVEVIERASA